VSSTIDASMRFFRASMSFRNDLADGTDPVPRPRGQ
jgi:hypothetical protein